MRGLNPGRSNGFTRKGKPLSYRVEKMKLSKDKTRLKVNESLVLTNIPPEVFDYRLGTGTALEWVIRPVPGERG